MLSALFSIATSACPSSARAKFRFRICSVRHALACGLPKTQDLLNGHARSVGYQYAEGGLLAAITYPDGRILQYQYDATGQITGLTWAGQAIVQGITWNPLGQPTGWSWSLPGGTAAIPATRSYNSAGQLTATELGSYQYDAAGRIVTLKQKLWRPANTNPQASTISQATITWSASYDNAGRLASLTKTTAAGAPPDTIAFQYDTNGNLLGSQRERAGTSTTRSYSTEAGHNKLLGFEQTSTSSTGSASASASVNYQYDSAGSLQTDGLHRYSYDSQGRLQSASTGQGSDAPTTKYAHNALGQRVFKTEALYSTSSSALDEDEEDLGLLQSIQQFFTRLWSPKASDAEHLGWSYLYDENASLLGDYGMGGANSGGQGQYFYLPTASGPMPIAAEIDGRIYAIHSDHLNTPRRLTQADGQTAWQWAYSAYGDEAPTLGANRFTDATTTPTTGSTSIPPVRFNLRYPGQYFDEETGLHYNYFRSYDPKTGRYTQGDPIGLEGGWNRFAYVGGNALSRVDPDGLRWLCIIPLGCTWQPDPPIDPYLPPPPPITFPNPFKPIINFINSCFPEESCEEKWNEEHKACQKWAGFGARWVRACRDRANDRLALCLGNGGTMPPSAPEPWRPDSGNGGRR